MKLTIIGASGHGKVAADIARLNGYDEIEFLDDNTELHFCGKWPVVGTTTEALKKQGRIFVAIGNADTREQMMNSLHGKEIITLIHPDAVVAEDVEIGVGTIIMAGVVINPGAKIGKGSIVNTCASVDHDCTVGDFCHISVGAHLSGTVSVGNNSWIGIGAVVSNNIDICNDCIIGAGAVVVKSISEPGTYIGVPAKMIHGVEK